MSDAKLASWNQQNVEAARPAALRMFPAEYLLKAMLSGRYFSRRTTLGPQTRVLDIGCLYVNNLAPFADRGAQLHGIEVNDDMIGLAARAVAAWGFPVDVRQGTNRAIPFDDGFFDVVLSINTLHYEDGPEAIDRALQEYRRVGRAGCHVLISTTASGHMYHRGADRLGPNRYRLHTDEFRDGQVMGYFDSREHLAATLARAFEHVEVATITEEYPACTVQYWVAKCAKD